MWRSGRRRGGPSGGGPMRRPSPSPVGLSFDDRTRRGNVSAGRSVPQCDMAEVLVTAATSFLSIRNYIEARYGSGSFRRVREVVVERSHPDYPAVLVPTAWYPTSMVF